MKMKIRLTLATAFLALIGLFNNCAKNPSTSDPSSNLNSNNQQQKIPINTAGWSDSPFISRDGQRLYFMYSRYDFGPWIKSGGTQMPVLAGPDRPGLNKNEINPFDESDIYVATKNPDGTWGEAVNLGLNGAYGDASGMEINNGNTFVWLRGNGVTTNPLVMAHKNGDGSWGSPIDFGAVINDFSSGAINDNPHISEDGNGLWFVSTRPGGLGGRDIWFSAKSGGTWSNPVNVTFMNSAGDEDQPWMRPGTYEVYWNSPQGLKTCVYDPGANNCTAAPTVITIPGCSFVAEASMPDDGQTLYYGCGNLTTGRVSIMYSVKQSDGSWGQATPVD